MGEQLHTVGGGAELSIGVGSTSRFDAWGVFQPHFKFNHQ